VDEKEATNSLNKFCPKNKTAIAIDRSNRSFRAALSNPVQGTKSCKVRQHTQVAPEKDSDSIHRWRQQGDVAAYTGRHQQGETKNSNRKQEGTCGRLEKILRGQRQQGAGEGPRWLHQARNLT
jgi:hypothetical protein